LTHPASSILPRLTAASCNLVTPQCSMLKGLKPLSADTLQLNLLLPVIHTEVGHEVKLQRYPVEAE